MRYIIPSRMTHDESMPDSMIAPRLIARLRWRVSHASTTGTRIKIPKARLTILTKKQQPRSMPDKKSHGDLPVKMYLE